MSADWQIRHGRKRYQKGCRCETCRAAQQRHNREQLTCRRCSNPLQVFVRGRLCGLCVEELEKGIEPDGVFV